MLVHSWAMTSWDFSNKLRHDYHCVGIAFQPDGLVIGLFFDFSFLCSNYIYLVCHKPAQCPGGAVKGLVWEERSLWKNNKSSIINIFVKLRGYILHSNLNLNDIESKNILMKGQINVISFTFDWFEGTGKDNQLYQRKHKFAKKI